MREILSLALLHAQSVDAWISHLFVDPRNPEHVRPPGHSLSRLNPQADNLGSRICSRDTQCGFKLCTRASAATIYPLLHSPSWIFDCELLLLASLAGIPIREVGIQWHEVDGSKVDLVRDSIAMAVDLLVIRANYACGKWQRPKWVGIESVQDGERIAGHEESAKSK